MEDTSMRVYERDDRHVTQDELLAITSQLSQSARDSLLAAVPRSITYSKQRRRMYFVLDQSFEYETRKRVKGEIQDAATVVFGHKTTLKVAAYQVEFNDPWCFECGSESGIEWHHVVPESLGGLKTVPLCDHCHGIVTSDQNLSAIGKDLWKRIDERINGDDAFPDKVAQRCAGRFVSDDRLARMTELLIELNRIATLRIAFDASYNRDNPDRVLQRASRELLRELPLPTDRRYTQADLITRTNWSSQEAIA